MLKQIVFSIFITKAILKTSFHFIMLLLEYIIFIFPYIFNAPVKISSLNKPNGTEYYSSSSLNKIFIFRLLHLSIYIPIGLSAFAIFFLIVYIMIRTLDMPHHKYFTAIQWSIVFVIDIILFRYLSIIFFDSALFSMFYFMSKGGFVNNLIGFLFLILFIVLLLSSYQYIQTFIMIISIANPLLVQGKNKKYPYDPLSKKYDIPMMILKAIVTLEFNYHEFSKKLDTIVISLNCLIILINFFFFGQMIYSKLRNQYSLKILYANQYLNYVRHTIAIFSFFICFLGLIIFSLEKNILKALIYTVLISLNISLFMIIFEHKDFMKNFFEKHPLSYQVLLLMQISDVKTNYLMFKKLADSCYLHHQFECILPKCDICLNFNDNINDSFLLFYKYYKKKQKILAFNDQLVKLLHLKSTKKTFKFFIYYYTLLNKYEQKNIEYYRNLRLIVEHWLIKEIDEQSDIILLLIQMKDFEIKAKDLINKMQSFFQDDILLKQPESVVLLSEGISIVLSKLVALAKKNDTKALSSHIDNNKNTNNSIFHYHILMLRFVFETLINRPLDELPELSIEIHEETLNSHFKSDQILICNIELSSGSFHHINLIKATGLLSHKNNRIGFLCEYFPKKIRKNGIEILRNVLKQTQLIYSNKHIFEFPFISFGYLNYIKYSFTLLESIKDSKLILYGQYYKDSSRYLLLNINQQQNHNIEIIGFCKEILKKIHFKVKWLSLLEEINIKFFLKSFFRVKELNYDDLSLIKCELNYKRFVDKCSHVISQLKLIEKFKAKKKNIIEIDTMMKALSCSNKPPSQITLEKVMAYSNEVMLYKINEKDEGSTVFFDNHDKGITNMNEDNRNNDYTGYSYSNSSVSGDNGSGSRGALKKFKGDEYMNVNINLRKKIQSGTTTLSVYSFIMIGLNALLIIICLIFLITQITQTQLLSNLNDFYFKFKTLRMLLLNFFVTLTATTCGAEDPTKERCVNGFKKYNDYFSEKYGLDKKFMFLEYLSREVTLKAHFGQTIVISFKDTINRYSSLNFDSILTNPMRYQYFKEENKKMILIDKSITFEEGIRQFINIILVVTQAETPYIYVPIYYINYANNTFTFDHVPNGTLSLLQQQIYQGIINYINYFGSFNVGEAMIKERIFSIKDLNEVINYAFMISIASLNLILLFICHKNIQIAYSLFKMLITNAMYKIEEKDCAKTLRNKIKNLLIILNLYEKRPYDIIKKLICDNQITKLSSGTTGNKSQDEHNDYSNKPRIIFGYTFQRFLLAKLILIYFLAFLIYYAIIISFDTYLITTYALLFKQFDYIYLQYEYENYVYITIAFTFFKAFGNFTEDDFATVLLKVNPPDGTMNMFIRANQLNFEVISTYISSDPIQYPTLQNFFNEYTCECIFTQYDDPYFMTISKEVDKDYREVSILLCQKFQLLNKPNFEYMFVDIIYRTQFYLNRKMGNDYAAVYAYTNSFELYELCTLTLFTLRVLFKTFRDAVLLPSITNKFQLYVNLMWIYLTVNIILEIVIFIIMKWFISNKLATIQKNLYLFNHCLS